MSSARTAALAAAVAALCGALVVPTAAAAAPQDVPPPSSNGAVFTALARHGCSTPASAPVAVSVGSDPARPSG